METRYIRGQRYYVHTEGGTVPGVSGIKSMLPAPALFNWAKNETAWYCINNLETIMILAEKDRAGALELVKNATSRHSRLAADRGTEVHALAEQIMRDKMAGVKSSFHATKDDMLYLKNLARFIREFEVEPVFVETTVWSREHNYAGTTDLICRLKGYPGLSIVDYKTGASGIYSDVAVQQVGYVRADSYIDEEGKFQPMPPIERAMALWLRPDGFALIPLQTDEEVWKVFLHLREIFDYVKGTADKVVGKPVNKTPLKKTWKPPKK